MLLVGSVPSAGLFSISGLLLILYATKKIGEIVKDREIYDNMVVGIAVGLVAEIVAFFFVIGPLLNWISSLSSTAFSNPFLSFTNLFGRIIVGLAVVWILLLFSSFLVKKCYDSIALHLKEDLFAVTGRLYLIGAALTIVVGIGLILLFVADTLQMAAFLSIPEQQPG